MRLVPPLLVRCAAVRGEGGGSALVSRAARGGANRAGGGAESSGGGSACAWRAPRQRSSTGVPPCAHRGAHAWLRLRVAWRRGQRGAEGQGRRRQGGRP